MRNAGGVILVLCLTVCMGCQDESSTSQNVEQPDVAADGNSIAMVTDQIVEASCGQCQFEMEGKGCDLAVRIDGESYYVDGSSIDDHGDAHGDDGLCNCIRRAKVTGEVKDGRFIAISFRVLPRENDAKSSDEQDAAK